VRNLQAYEQFLNGDSTMVLSTDSDLFRYLNSHRDMTSATQAGP
jgi:hypothetical protein